MTGPYPATLEEAHAEIRALRVDLLALHARIQTRESWAAEPMDDVRRHWRERQTGWYWGSEESVSSSAQGVGEEVIRGHAAD